MVSESFNLEAPSYLSTESAVLIYARQDAQCIDCFQAFLPVHYRYHRPHKKDGDTLIVVNNPDLLMHCDQGEGGNKWKGVLAQPRTERANAVPL